MLGILQEKKAMEVKLIIENTYDVKYLAAEVRARYWEDATVNGVVDVHGDLIPCRHNDYWYPLIDVESGIIVNWTKGVEAEIHYKVCDNGTYRLLDADKKEITAICGYYVPNIMCPKDEGYGDYVIMDVDAEGKIADWKPTFDDFNTEL